MKTKRQVIARVAASLGSFYPECANHFLCPTCLNRIPVSRQEDISVAHILPRAAGGGLATLLCRSCNSGFGSRQDKWMGEYLRLMKAGGAQALNVIEQCGYFEVGGVRVSGRYRIAPDGQLEFLVRKDKTSPAALAAMREQLARARGGSLGLTIPLPPLFKNKDLVTIGFVTAAYLMWFRELGYSWALQQYLEPVRQQIRTPVLSVLPKHCCAAVPSGSWMVPWVGVGEVAGELALLAGLSNRVVFFPPADRKDLYERLPQDLDGIRIERLRGVRFFEHHTFEGPMGVLYGNRTLISPDVLFKGANPVLYLPPEGTAPRMLYPITKAEFDEGVRHPNAFRLKSGEGVLIPGTDTGRPPKHQQ